MKQNQHEFFSENFVDTDENDERRALSLKIMQDLKNKFCKVYDLDSKNELSWEDDMLFGKFCEINSYLDQYDELEDSFKQYLLEKEIEKNEEMEMMQLIHAKLYVNA